MIRVRQVTGGYIVEKKIIKWTLFGLKVKWLPFVETSGLREAWIHSTFDFAIMNAKKQLEEDLIEDFIK